MRRPLSRSALVLFATASLAASGAAFAQQDPSTQQLPPGQVPAVLKAREVNFTYRSTSSPLACDELRNRVATILREVGARDDVQVTARECDAFLTPNSRPPSRSGPTMSGTFEPGGSGTLTDPYADRTSDRMRMTRADQYDNYRSQTTPVHITVMMPTLITAETLDEVEKDKARRELISRVQGNPAAALDSPIFFAAERREVTLSHETIELEPIDCELLEQMTRSVFRKLDLKVTGQALSCDPRSHFKPHLTVEALLPVGYLMPGEQQAQKRKQEAAQRKAPEPPPPAPEPPAQ
jgi:hypothetical protein